MAKCKFDEMYERCEESTNEILKKEKQPLEKQRMQAFIETSYRDHKAAIIEAEFQNKELRSSLSTYDINILCDNERYIKDLKERMEFIEKEYKDLFGVTIPFIVSEKTLKE